MGSLIVLIILVVLALYAVSVYNRIVAYEKRYQNAWSQIDVQLKRRADLVPNLVNTVRGIMQQEREVLVAVTEARARVGGLQTSEAILDDPERFAQFQQAQQQLGSALQRLMVVVERYPELRSSQNFLTLQSQLEGTENRIAVARRDFIQAVQRYNTELRTFPGRIWHAILYSDMTVRPSFEATSENAERAPEVNF